MLFNSRVHRSVMTLLAAGSLIIATPIFASEAPAAAPKVAAKSSPNLDVFKSPTCGCCQLWVDQLTAQGFTAKTHHPDDMDKIKEKYRIAPEVQSCHTAVSSDGYVFEGHIPAKVIKQFLKEKPANSIGLAVPGMPAGSPGMEMGDRFTPYDVLLLKSDGSTSVYTRINTAGDQK